MREAAPSGIPCTAPPLDTVDNWNSSQIIVRLGSDYGRIRAARKRYSRERNTGLVESRGAGIIPTNGAVQKAQAVLFCLPEDEQAECWKAARETSQAR